MYLQGHSTGVRPRLAASWLKKAAYQGYRAAQYQLGMMYFNGLGVRQNDVRAYGWWHIAIQENNEATPELMAQLIERMEPGIREKAVVLAERYRKKYH
jgi:TPR repeat protein